MSSNITDMFLGDSTRVVDSVIIALTVIGSLANMVSIAAKVILKFALPDTWKYIIIFLDTSHLSLGLGLALLFIYVNNGITSVCHGAGFFILFGALDSLFIYFMSAIILMFIQNPERLSGYSSYKKWPIPAMLIPQKILFIALSFIPFLPVSYFDNQNPFPIVCFPIRDGNSAAAGYGGMIVFLLWLLIIAALIVSLVCALRLWKSAKGRIHASSPNIWQLMMLGQGKTFQKFLLVEQTIWIGILFVVTIVLYTNSDKRVVPQWIVIIAFCVMITLHAIFSNIQTILWSTLCCKTKQQAKEPHQKLKKLELLKIEAPGKLRMKATWSVGKGNLKHGLLKVYSLDHLKSWAQEIVILGMMRKIQNASLLQCLWTNNNNPYYDTMMLITGEIVTSDSRLICMEWTSSGTLRDFLNHLDIPLPEPCQKTIIHDIAEGLACLHEQNILHQNLTSATVYLKGSLERLVLRAAIGDFENAQICGSLQSGVMSNVSNKKQFFLPDIRAFALVTLEIIGLVCDKRLEYISYHSQMNSQDMFCTETPRSYPESASENSADDIPYFGKSANVNGQNQNMKEAIRSRNHELVSHPNISNGDNSNKVSNVKSNLVSSSNFNQQVLSVQQYSRSNNMGFRNGFKKRRAPDIPQKIPESPPINEEVSPWNEDLHCTFHQNNDYPQTHFQSSRQDSEIYVEPAGVNTHRSYSFPQESIFKGRKLADNEYEEIEEIAEEIERTYGKMGASKPSRKTPSLKDDPEYVSLDIGTYASYGQVCEGKPMHKCPSDHRSVYSMSKMDGQAVNNDRRGCSSLAKSPEAVNEILPGMADDTETSGPSLKELWLAREAQRKQYLIECYDERMKPMLRDLLTEKERRSVSRGQILDANKTQLRSDKMAVQMKSNQSLQMKNNVSSQTKSNASVQTNNSQKQRYVSGISVNEQVNTQSRPYTSVPSSSRSISSRPATAQTAGRPQTAQNANAKKNKARNILTRQLQRPSTAIDKDRGKSAAAVEQKYASQKRQSNVKNENEGDVLNRGETPCESKDQVHRPETHAQPNENNGGKFSSFSSNDSFSSYFRNNPRKQQTTSLTSGELTSLSSQAYSSEHCNQDGYVTEHDHEYDIPVHKIKVSPTKDVKIDSGFDSGSVKSEEGSLQELEIDDQTCSCPTDETCSCQYSVTPTEGMHTKPIYPQSGNESFSSYDFSPQRDNFMQNEGDIIGPDQQYPSGRPTNGKNMNIKTVRKTRSKERIQWKRNMKRYKELVTRGVPLRVSVVSASEHSETDRDSVMESTAEIIEEDDNEEEEWDSDDEILFQGLEAQVPFANSDTDTSCNTDVRYSQKGAINRFNEYESISDCHSNRKQPKRKRSNADVLDEIIRELPDEITGESSADESRVIVDSKRNQSVSKQEHEHEQHSEYGFHQTDTTYSKYPLVDAEMAIDKMFTQQNHSINDIPVFGLDERSMQQPKFLSEGKVTSNTSNTVNVPLLKGVSTDHVKYCRLLTSKISILKFDELLPARTNNFEVMKSKLQHAGKFGSIGNQLLETAQSCWLSDTPPTSAEIVYRLTDTIAETEL